MKQPHLLFEDNHLLVVDKPPGWIVQGAQSDDLSLLQWGKDYLKHKYQKPGSVFLAAVSRLDRQVSGVVPLARTSKSAARLNQQIAGRQVTKEYIAIVSPVPNIQQSRLEHYLTRNERAGKSMAHAHPVSGSDQAIMQYQVLQVEREFAAIKILLETGRKHQIRCQLEAIGCPIIGDIKYGSKQRFHGNIALHCYRLQMLHPTQRTPLELTSMPPEDWIRTRFPWESLLARDNDE